MKKIIAILIFIFALTGCQKTVKEPVLELGETIIEKTPIQELSEIDKDLAVKEIALIEQSRENDSVITAGLKEKRYTSGNKTVEILDNGDTVFKAELLTDYKLMVGPGKEVKIAEIRLIDWDKNDTLFDIVDFYDRENNFTKINNSLVFKYTTDFYITKASKGLDENGNEILVDKLVPDWNKAVKFNSLSELPSKDIFIGIYTNTILNQKIEWLPTVGGFPIYEWATYEVTELNSLQFTANNYEGNSLVKIDDTHFILAYAGADASGFIATYSINGSYEITNIDSLEHDTTKGSDNSLVMIDSTHFILAYEGTDSDGFISTFSIDGSYDNITEIDSLEHDTVYGEYNFLAKIDDTHFILAYEGTDYDGFISTFSIDESYDNITEIDSLEHDIIQGKYNSLVKIDDTHFILAYRGDGDDGYIKTFSIDGSYDNITEIDSLEHDTTLGWYSSLVKIDDTHFILSYTGADADGYIKTFSIDGNYDNITEINSLEHDATNGTYNSLVMIDSTHFILAYAGTDSDGFISTFSIDGSYAITEVDSLEHDTSNGLYNSLVQIDTGHYILAYCNGGNGLTANLTTFSVDVPAEEEEEEEETPAQSEFWF